MIPLFEQCMGLAIYACVPRWRHVFRVSPTFACCVLQVHLSTPIVPHVQAAAAGVFAQSLSIQHTHRIAQGLGCSVELKSKMDLGHGRTRTMRVLVPPKFDSEGRPLYEECEPVADPWKTKSPKWEYFWRLATVCDDGEVSALQSLLAALPELVLCVVRTSLPCCHHLHW